MSRKNKAPYIPPEARLICFRPVERIATEDEETFEGTMALFSSKSGASAQSIISFEITDPDLDLD